jgi:hypothetical protein
MSFVFDSLSPCLIRIKLFFDLVFFFNSSKEEINSNSSFSLFFQTGKGAPQYRERETAQSLVPSNQFANLFSPICFGIQLIFLFSEINLSFIFGDSINQESVA